MSAIGFPSHVHITGLHPGGFELRSSAAPGRSLSLWGAIAVCFAGSLVLGVLITSSVLLPGAAAVAFLLLVAAASYFSSVLSALATAAVAFLFEDGFLYDTRGVLAWHGSEDFIRLGGLLVIAIAVSMLGRWLTGPERTSTSAGDE